MARIWTRTELERIEATNALMGQRFELIEGLLIDKSGKQRRHAIATKATVKALRAVFDDDFIETEVPIDVAPGDLPRNQPEPDIIVLRQPFGAILSNPGPGDILLAVEVAGTSQRQDLKVKAGLYARAGIAEYWVLDLNLRCLHVLRQPDNGVYQESRELGESESIVPLGGTGVSIPVAAMLPPQQQ